MTKGTASVFVRAFILALVLMVNLGRGQTGGYAVTARGADWTVRQKVVVAGGVTNVHQYTELATGLNYTNGYGELVPAQEQITLLPAGGAAATQGRHQVYFPADIYNGVLEVVTPDGRHLYSRPLGVSYDDGSNTVFLGTLTNAIGELAGSNQVIYPDAFSGFKADLRCTYRRGGFECDLVFRQQPPAPGQFGLAADNCTLQLVTEFFNTADPQQIPAATDEWYGLQDSTLKFGALSMTHGKAFALAAPNAAARPVAVYKRWLRLDGRKFLIEEVPLPDLAADLAALPLTALNRSGAAAGAGLAAVTPSRHRQLPPAHARTAGTNQMLLAAAGFNRQPGVVLDYNTVDDGSDSYTFETGQTYYISGTVNLTGTTTIQGGAVIKYDSDAQLAPGSVVCATTADNPAILTSVNDDSVGVPIDGVSTGIPAVDHMVETGDPGSFGAYICFPEMEGTSFYHFQHLRFLYAHCAIADASDKAAGPNEVDDAQFINCGTAWMTFNSTIFLQNDLFSDCQAIVVTGNGVDVQAVNMTADHCWTFINDSYLNGGMVELTNSLITDVTTMMSVTNWSGWVPYIYPAEIYLDHSVMAGSTNGFSIMSSVSSSQIPSAAAIYQTAAGAGYYLAAGSPCHDAGTTNIDPGLLAELQTMTTYAPPDGGWPDTNGTDLGYHYPVNEDADHDGLPDAWEWHWFGSYTNTGSTPDSQGNPLRYDYQNGLDPNVIRFSIAVTNRYVNTACPIVPVKVTAGVPGYYAVLLNATNLASTNWLAFTTTNLTVNLGATDGVYGVSIGLRGLPATATQTWASVRLVKDTVAPVLAVTNPAAGGTVGVPLVQVQGWADEELGALTYAVSNAAGVFTGQRGYWQPGGYDAGRRVFTNDLFQAYDVGLTDGLNVVTVTAADLAGNVTVTNVSVTLAYTAATNAPGLTILWPPENALIGGSSVTVQAQVADPTATVAAAVNGHTVPGLVERSGLVWLQSVPLDSGTNLITLTATGAAGQVTVTNLCLVQSAVSLSIDPLSPDQLNRSSVTVTGTVGSASCTVWVNGMPAAVSGDPVWVATNVPVSPSGTAMAPTQRRPAGGLPHHSGQGGAIRQPQTPTRAPAPVRHAGSSPRRHLPVERSLLQPHAAPPRARLQIPCGL